MFQSLVPASNGRLGGPCEMPGIEPGSAAYEVNTLPTMLSVQSPPCRLFPKLGIPDYSKPFRSGWAGPGAGMWAPTPPEAMPRALDLCGLSGGGSVLLAMAGLASIHMG